MRPSEVVATCAAYLSACATASTTSSLDRRQESGAVPAASFLRRGYHASAVLDGWLYIDGGEAAYLTTSAGVNYIYSTSLLAIDLSKSFTTASAHIYDISKPPNAPFLRDGGLWVDESAHLLYTGFGGRESWFDGKYSPVGLWSFAPDGKGGGTWANMNSSAPDFMDVPRRIDGQAASGSGKGYYLGGFAGNFSTQLAEEKPVAGMLVYDFAQKTLTNTAVGVSTEGKVQRGDMMFVPNFGPEGIIVSIGGGQRGKTDPGRDFLVSMGSVQIYDPAKQTWHEQTTMGSPPAPRKDYCVAGAASNNRTYEILVYGGWGGNLGDVSRPYDVAYVLSLPSFRWFKADYQALHPRHGVTCNAIGGGKVLTIGGVDTTMNDFSPPYWLYGHVFDSADNFKQGLGIFDLSTMEFTDSFSPPAPGEEGYTLYPEIQSFYDKNGRHPTFDTTGLADLFATENFTVPAPGSPTSAPGSPPSSPLRDNPYSGSSPNVGAIVGGVIGGVAVIGLMIGAAFLWLRRRRQEGPKQLSDSSVLMHMGGGMHDTPDGAYYAVPPHPKQAPADLSEMPVHYYNGGRSPTEYYPSGLYDQQSAKYHDHLQPDVGGGYMYQPHQQSPVPQQPPHQYLQESYELQSSLPPGELQSIAPPGELYSEPHQSSRIHEIPSHHDGRAAGGGEDNFKYNVRF